MWQYEEMYKIPSNCHTTCLLHKMGFRSEREHNRPWKYLQKILLVILGWDLVSKGSCRNLIWRDGVSQGEGSCRKRGKKPSRQQCCMHFYSQSLTKDSQCGLVQSWSRICAKFLFKCLSLSISVLTPSLIWYVLHNAQCCLCDAWCASNKGFCIIRTQRLCWQ